MVCPFFTERGSIEVNIYQGRDLVAKDVNGKKTGLQVTEHLRLRARSPFGGHRKKYTRVSREGRRVDRFARPSRVLARRLQRISCFSSF